VQTAKQALAPGRVPVPTTPVDGPDPNAPNATQFFVAAAGVSTGSKVKRVLFFVIGAILVGTALFCLVYFQLIKKEHHLPGAGAAQPAQEEPAAAEPPPPEPAPAGPGALTPGEAPAAPAPSKAP